jgi:hypothetical protein
MLSDVASLQLMAEKVHAWGSNSEFPLAVVISSQPKRRVFTPPSQGSDRSQQSKKH